MLRHVAAQAKKERQFRNKCIDLLDARLVAHFPRHSTSLKWKRCETHRSRSCMCSKKAVREPGACSRRDQYRRVLCDFSQLERQAYHLDEHACITPARYLHKGYIEEEGGDLGLEIAKHIAGEVLKQYSNIFRFCEELRTATSPAAVGACMQKFRDTPSWEHCPFRPRRGCILGVETPRFSYRLSRSGSEACWVCSAVEVEFALALKRLEVVEEPFADVTHSDTAGPVCYQVFTKQVDQIRRDPSILCRSRSTDVAL